MLQIGKSVPRLCAIKIHPLSNGKNIVDINDKIFETLCPQEQ